MYRLAVVLLIVFSSEVTLAQRGGQGSRGGKNFMIGALYGQAAINPGDINTHAKQNATNPDLTALPRWVLWRFLSVVALASMGLKSQL